jgi:phosphatidylglycerol:prolipoprotein diacylglycerol transferase
LHPVLFHVGRFDIPSYGVLIAIGILIATAVSFLLARKRGVSADFVLDCAFWAVVAGFIGARAAYILVDWEGTLRDPIGALFGSGGGIYIVGAVAGAAAIAYLARRRRIPIALAADVFAPGLSLAHAFGRVGCFLAGCCYGAICNPAVGVRYPRTSSPSGEITGSWPYLDHLQLGLVSVSDRFSLPVYPVQLVEAAANLAIFCFLVWIFFKKKRSGTVALSYIWMYSAMRFVLEFFRGDSIRGIYGGLSFSQWICLGVVAVLLILPRVRAVGRV